MTIHFHPKTQAVLDAEAALAMQDCLCGPQTVAGGFVCTRCKGLLGLRKEWADELALMDRLFNEENPD